MKLNYLSGLTTKISLYCNEEPILTAATGFFYEFMGHLHLVTNWHVFSGRNTYTGQPIDKSCSVPDKVKFNFRSQDTVLRECEVELRDELGVARWYEHIEHGQDVDVAVLGLPDDWSQFQFARANTTDDRKDMIVEVGDDVFILGYPKAINKQGELPVWKRGSIASEPFLPVDGKECMLIDAATRDGMSGSPVFKYSRNLVRTKAGTIGGEDASRLVGVYSGRYGASDLDGMQLARCWWGKLIDEIILGGKPGDYQLRTTNEGL